MKKLLSSCVALILLAMPMAWAEGPCGAVVCLSELSVNAASDVQDMVADGRIEFENAFEGVARVHAAMPELDATKRGRLAVVGPALRGFGDGALPAILERIVLHEPRPEGWAPSAWTAWQIGLLDAAGRYRDPRAGAVLEAVCRSRSTSPELLEVAAAALGRLESDAAAAALVDLSRIGGERGLAVLAGMGHCRRLAVVQRLVEALPAQQSPAAHRRVSRSLATAANGLVWRAGLTAHADEAEQIRDLAVRALLKAFVSRSDMERRGLMTAILVVEHSETLDLVASYRTTADPPLTAALDELTGRFEANPVSRMATPR